MASHLYRSYSGDVPYRSPSRMLSADQASYASSNASGAGTFGRSDQCFGRSGYGRDIATRDQTAFQGSKLLEAALAGKVDISKFLSEETARARDAISKSKTTGAASSPSGYTMRTNPSTGEFSPRSAFGVPQLGGSTVTTTEVDKKQLKHYQWKDRIAGGGALPLEETEQERKVAHFLDMFAQGNTAAVRKLCDKAGMSATGSCDKCSSNGLHYASRTGNLQGMKLAAELGAEINGANQGGMLPVHYAALQAATAGKLTQGLQWLVMEGANLDATTNSGFTAAQLAAEVGKSELVSEWLELHKKTPKWIASKETIAAGGPQDRIFKAPCTGECRYY